MAAANVKWLVGLAVLMAPQLSRAECFQTVSQLKANKVNLVWREMTANDGKPMVISIANGPGGLDYTAKKHGALWLSGNVSVCRVGGATKITLENTRATNHVPMIARWALPATQSGRIVNNHITLGGSGWSGTFAGV